MEEEMPDHTESGRESRKRRLPVYRIIIAGLLLLFVAFNFIPSGYYLIEPGPPLALHEIIEVEDSYRQDDWGSFYLTSVGQRRASLWDVFQFVLMPVERDSELTPVEASVPPGMTEEEYVGLMARLMEESQLEAQAVAYREVGFDVSIKGIGVEVIDILDDSPAEGYLKTGDIITAINGREIEMATEAVDIISDREIGEAVRLKIKREDEELTEEISTYEHHDRPGQASLGIMITTAGLEYSMPELVRFAERDLVGPSAGIMFALEIYNQLTEEDLTSGQKIAGSGEIDHHGNISRVAGTDLKVAAAVKESAGYFITSPDNEEEARMRADDSGISVISGDKFSQIVEELRSVLD